MTDTATATGTEPLTALDRCDACGSAAKVRATLASGELLFCGHHANRYLPALLADGKIAALHDERDFAVN